MQRQPINLTRSRAATALLAGLALTLVVLILAYPDDAFQASLGALRLWWTVLVPALLPYLAVVELFAGFGLVRAFGALAEPLLRTLFRLPPGGGRAVVAGLLGGFPHGAAAARRLVGDTPIRQSRDRLFQLSQLCSPALLITVVGAGFLHSVRAGVFLAAVHYLSAGAAAWLSRLVQTDDAPPAEISPAREKPAETFLAALQAGRREDGRSFGQLLGDAVMASIQALFSLSGFLILFSVLARMISLQLPEGGVGRWFLLIPGLLEPHLGAYAAATRMEPSTLQLGIIAAALAWGGFSQMLQLKAVAGSSSPGYRTMVTGRLLHALLAFALTFAVAPLAGGLLLSPGAPGFTPTLADSAASGPVTALGALFAGGWATLCQSLRLSLAAAALPLGIVAFCCLFRKKAAKR